MRETAADFLICGGGIVGLTIARALLGKGCENILIIEKEETLGKHASGRNSGVLHAGIYYGADSVKAQSCLRGNVLMKQYCREKGLPLLESGKVIIAVDKQEREMLQTLFRTALANGAQVEVIDEKQLAEIEPYAKTSGIALYSPQTAVVDPGRILKSILKDLISSGKVRVHFNTRLTGVKGSSCVKTNAGEITFGTFINASGTESDRVAHLFGVGLNYRLVPFKGIYKKLRKEKSYLVKGNIYRVPDTRNPFLGLHFTRDINGEVFIGPTAIPALGRENYGLLKGIDREAVGILARDVMLFFSNERFRRIVLAEPKKYVFRFFYEDARSLVYALEPADIIASDKTGIRPQLVDWNRKELVMDYLIIKDGSCLHLLNTISPAFTSSMHFAEFVLKYYIQDS
jgi:L-2-hydroxyglutarate oxidase LhgO